MHRSVLLVALLAAATASAQVSVEIVLDASEAMLGPGVAGLPIYVSLGDAVTAIVAEATESRPELLLALRVAGGRGDLDERDPCEATRVALNPAEPDHDLWAEALDAVEPDGPRPLIASVLAALGDDRSASSARRIVIVTSGDDECGLEPGAVAAALAAEEAPPELRMVGLGLDPAMVEKFGGVPIRNVATAEDLLDALRWAVLEPGDETAEVEDTGPQAAIDAPSQVLAGGQVEVLWSGPEGDEDFLCLAPSGSPDDAYLEWARTEDGNPLVFRAPKEPGDYELRYVEGLGGTVLARVPLEVANIPVALRAATRVRAGRRFEVSWTGPASAGDFLSITKPGTHARHHFDWASTTTGSPITLAAPAKPGTYEIRYVVGRDREVLARFTIEVVE